MSDRVKKWITDGTKRFPQSGEYFATPNGHVVKQGREGSASEDRLILTPFDDSPPAGFVLVPVAEIERLSKANAEFGYSISNPLERAVSVIIARLPVKPDHTKVLNYINQLEVWKCGEADPYTRDQLTAALDAAIEALKEKT